MWTIIPVFSLQKEEEKFTQIVVTLNIYKLEKTNIMQV